jgi:antitoxin ParD1/3/4
MTMTVELGSLESVVEGFVAHGRFNSKSEVLREGVRLLQEREARLAALHAKLDAGVAELDAGLGIPLEQVRAEMRMKFGVTTDI